jgi:hypothetical protein
MRHFVGGSIPARFVCDLLVDRVPVEQGLSECFGFLCQNYFSNAPYTHFVHQPPTLYNLSNFQLPFNTMRFISILPPYRGERGGSYQTCLCKERLAILSFFDCRKCSVFSWLLYVPQTGLLKFYVICTVHSVICYSQTNKCTTNTNKVYLAAPTYVSATNFPSSEGRPKNHSYSRHPTTRTVSITIKAHTPLTTLHRTYCTTIQATGRDGHLSTTQLYT